MHDILIFDFQLDNKCLQSDHLRKILRHNAEHMSQNDVLHYRNIHLINFVISHCQIVIVLMMPYTA